MAAARDAPRWVVFATFSATGRPAPHVRDQLAAYRAAGFDVLVVDASPHVDAERRADWERLATHWLPRDNLGYDFGSWRAGCDWLTGERRVPVEALHLVLTNDSCFGPYLPIGEVMSRLAALPAPANPVFGITDSRETSHHHLQSYWLYFPPGAARLAVDFLRGMALATDREAAIVGGELALSRTLREHGCTLVPLVRLETLMQRVSQRRGGRLLALLEFGVRRVFGRYRHTRRGDGACIKYLLRRPAALDYVNPTLDYGRFLYNRAWSPFVKIMLIRDNPCGDPGLPPASDVGGMTNAQAAAMLDAAARGRRFKPLARS